MKKPGHITLFLAAFLLAVAASATLAATASRSSTKDASQCIFLLEQGSINWTTGTIIAHGQAAPLENREKNADIILGTARTRARRNIIELIKKIPITSTMETGAYAAGNDVIMAGIEKTAMDARVSRQVYSSNGALHLTIETSMFGGFLQLVLPEEIRQIPEIMPAVETEKKGSVHQAVVFDYTGLIIDARDLDFTPVIYPKVLDEQGRQLYASEFISREYAVQKGIVAYHCDMEQAVRDDRIGINPIVIKGLRTGEENKSAIIINMSDTNQLEATAERHAFFRECRVIIVLGQ